MAVRFQIVVDCRDPPKLVRFWRDALHYVIDPPPKGWDSWDAYWRSIGVPEEELGVGPDSISDPGGGGPRIWFHIVPESKICKNRLHFDIRASGGRDLPLARRREQVEEEAARLVETGAIRLETLSEEGLDHYAVAMADPEGNEFDVN